MASCAFTLSKARAERFDLLLLSGYDRSLFLHFAMFFKELVEQHGVDLLVPDGLGLAGGIASYQIGRRSSHFFSDQAESKCLGRIKFLVKTEADRFKRVEYFAGFRDRFDVMFIPTRRHVTAAKSSCACYCHRIGIHPHNRLHVGVDIPDEAAVVYIRSLGADTDNVTSRGNA